MRDWADAIQSPVRNVIDAASRRSLLVLIVEHAAFVFAAVFAGVALLLLLGTDILDWQWLLFVAAIAVIAAYLRLRGHILSRYRIAQVVDRRLELHDTLSTAWFLLQNPTAEDRPSLAPAQIENAENIARTVEPARVFPFVWQRTWAIAAALATVAFSLFAVRYLTTSTLSLKQALIPLSFSLPAEVLEHIEKFAKRDSEGPRTLRAGINSSLRHEDRPKADDEAGQSGKPAEKGAAKPGTREGAQSSRTPDDPSVTKQPGGSENRGPNQERSDSRNPASQPDGKPGDRQAHDQQQSGNEANREDAHEQSPGLMDRMKDALSSLMAKARPQTSPKSDQQNRQEAKPGEQKAQNNSRSGQADQNPRTNQDTDSRSEQQSAQGQQQAQASEKSPGTQSNSSDESTNRKGSDAQSGIGRQDGEKSLKEAEQLRAMGKLDEIIGKRSASLTGDMTVETRSTTQPLQTQYSDHVGRHADLGGEIDRDEVPLPLQRYVRDYMEQVRRQPENQK